MFKLYPYQEDAVQNAVQMLDERGNSLIVAGTGAGKTIMMAAAIGRFFNGFYARYKRKPHVLVLVHRTEIHDQNHSKFSRVCPTIATSEITAARKSLHGNVHFGMVQTVANVLDDFARANSFFDLIVIDEAHHSKAATYESIIEWNKIGKPESCLLGVTATPNRGDQLPLIHLFDNYYQITSKFLIDSHYLVRPRFVDLSPSFKVEKNKKFVVEIGHLSKNCKCPDERRALISKLCRDYLANKEDGKTIIFAPSHEFCRMIYEELQALGRKCAYLENNIDDVSRKEEILRFEEGDCDELINVDICTEGYDFPALRNIVDFDTNGTQGQWIQKVGRVLRTAPAKTSCTVIDFGGNVDLYPDGVETGVNLNGVVKNEKGTSLLPKDFTERKAAEKAPPELLMYSEELRTPYNPPKGFETVLDADVGVVFVACEPNKDCIIVPKENGFTVYLGDKEGITKSASGSFETCTQKGMDWLGDIQENTERPISKLQIQLLAPEYATTAMDWHGANCCICWKTWKDLVLYDFNRQNYSL